MKRDQKMIMGVGIVAAATAHVFAMIVCCFLLLYAFLLLDAEDEVIYLNKRLDTRNIIINEQRNKIEEQADLLRQRRR